jgi:hypothetical protein
MNINIKELKNIVNKLLDHVASLNGEEISIDTDYFWDIDTQVRRNPYAQPNDFALGQLSENLDNLRKIGEDNILGYHLVWASNILREIGEDYSG